MLEKALISATNLGSVSGCPDQQSSPSEFSSWIMKSNLHQHREWGDSVVLKVPKSQRELNHH